MQSYTLYTFSLRVPSRLNDKRKTITNNIVLQSICFDKDDLFRLCRVYLPRTGGFLSLLRERKLNCCRVIVHIARRYIHRNWVKQRTIGIQATSQAHLRECRRRSINTKDNRFWRTIPRRAIDYQYFPRSIKENN